jgi:DNA invertase Pin-like site-specific DNA recombinase
MATPGKAPTAKPWRHRPRALKAAGCAKIFSEKVSGVVTDHKALVKAIDGLSKDDTLIVSRLDRLGPIDWGLLDTIPKKAPTSRQWLMCAQTGQRRTAD